MPLPNRVTPFGDLVAVPDRGLMMGNRGGRLHDDHRRLTSRRWSSPAWICCRLDFNNRHRQVWGDGYTELFFLDEPTALAAGHRPCFECRRNAAVAFATAWAKALDGARPSAPQMDRELHAERLAGRAKRLHDPRPNLPDGTFVILSNDAHAAFAIRGAHLLRWNHSGYAERLSREAAMIDAVLTPPRIVAALAAGYEPIWHPSAG
jgi:hypothetical protein